MKSLKVNFVNPSVDDLHDVKIGDLDLAALARAYKAIRRVIQSGFDSEEGKGTLKSNMESLQQLFADDLLNDDPYKMEIKLAFRIILEEE